MNCRTSLMATTLIVLFLSACGPSQADQNATLTKAAADAFATQTAEAPTATLTPTNTPEPTATPVPSPTPVPPDAESLLEGALGALEEAGTYHLEMEVQLGMVDQGISFDIPITTAADVALPDRSEGTQTVSVLGVTQTINFINDGEDTYTTDPESGLWQFGDDTGLATMIREFSGLQPSDFERLTYVSIETLDGEQVHHLTATGAPGLFEGDTDEEDRAFLVDFWIGAADGHLKQLAMEGEFASADLVGFGTDVDITIEIVAIYSDLGQDVVITAPEVQAVSEMVDEIVSVDEDKVCVVLDTPGETDRNFNQATFEGAKEAAEAAGLEFEYLTVVSPEDYERHVLSFASQGCALIITVNFGFADATLMAAREYPGVHFVIVDIVYNTGDYDKLPNVTSLAFASDEAGYLAGVLAGCVSESGVIGSVAGMEIPPVASYVIGYQNRARSQNLDIVTLNEYIWDFNDPVTGRAVGERMIADGADIIFAVGGNTGNGGLLAAHEAGLYGIGVDVDQYYTYPEVQSSLLSSAMKKIDLAVGRVVADYAAGDLEGGVRMATVANGGIGLAPYHDLEAVIPDNCKEAVKSAMKGLVLGEISTGYE